ncbi:MAG: FixH family protein [Roseovarius sp.]|uniref:FixH family protein n=1 Tax=Roseovarius sp. TaxID=1486281 RepID=UPI0032F04421
MTERQITGKHVFIGFASAFAIIIGVNLVLAFSAVRTFPGLEVKNSYVASQEFNDRKAAQEGLGWTIAADHADGMLTLGITDEAGEPVEVARLEATVGRATHVQDDQTPEFRFDGSAYVAPVALGDGNWNIRMKAWDEAGTLFQQRVVLHKD